jgi:hypothetical protein
MKIDDRRDKKGTLKEKKAVKNKLRVGRNGLKPFHEEFGFSSDLELDFLQQEVLNEDQMVRPFRFLITSDEGIKIIVDPHEPDAFGGQLSTGKSRTRPISF